MRYRYSVATLAAILGIAFLSLQHVPAVKAGVGAVKDDSSRTPVLIELFTSESCSDCPPADALLARLDRTQPVGGADLIVLSEHVDYWDNIGWRDPFSSRKYSERQTAYASHFGIRSIYTPQMVVDGHFEFVGSDERRALQTIQSATKSEKAQVALSLIRMTDDKTVSLHLEVAPLPASASGKSADIFVATADESDQSRVKGGENGGRTLNHVAVLRSLVRIGTLGKTGGFSQDVSVGLNGANLQKSRVIVIVQEMSVGKVWGAGSVRLPQ